MKLFRAIYDTATYQGIKYDFEAKDRKAALNYASKKFSAENVQIIEIDPETLEPKTLNIEDAKEIISTEDLKTTKHRANEMAGDFSGDNNNYQVWLNYFKFSSEQGLTYKLSIFNKTLDLSLFDAEISVAQYKEFKNILNA